jgi:radical SAM protein with 4Fe4S-binding SPASM domain
VKRARFALGILGRKPFQCLVQVTNRCNMRCSFCDFWPNGVAPSAELTVADYQRLSEEMARIGCFLVSVEGGEPTIRPDLVDIVAAFARHHLPVLYTNGWHVDHALASALFEAGVEQVGVSIDFPDAARHDAKRGLAGAWERAWRAVDHLAAVAPRGGRQVHVMTVLLEENRAALPAMLAQSAARDVGHCLTLVSTSGYRRDGRVDRPPSAPVSDELVALFRRWPHLRLPETYLEGVDDFLAGRPMPTCRAGSQSFNVDHVGNVAPCIEKIDRFVGNVREAPLSHLLARAASLDEVARCQDCWTLCRGMAQALGNGGRPSAWRDLATRLR